MTLGLGVKFYRYRNLVLRHWWILFLTVSSGLAYEGYVLYTKPQLFESKTDLFAREEMVSDSASRSFVDLSGQMLQTAAEEFKNPAVLEGAKDQLALSAPELQGTAAISSSVVPRTNILTVTAASTSPEYAQKYLVEVIEAFFKMRDEVRKRLVSNTSSDIDDRIQESNKKLDDAKKKLQAFIQENNMAFWLERAPRLTCHASRTSRRISKTNCSVCRTSRRISCSIPPSGTASLLRARMLPARGARTSHLMASFTRSIPRSRSS